MENRNKVRILQWLTLISIGLTNIQAESLNILGVFPFSGKSHFFVFKTYLEELAIRGHNVTVISYFPRSESMKNYHDITLLQTPITNHPFLLKRTYLTILSESIFLVSFGTDACKILLANEKVQNLWKSKQKFDLIVVEQFNSDCALGLAYKLGAPVVGLTSHLPAPWHYNRFGIPYNPSYVPFMHLEGGTKPTLYQRIERIIFNTYFNLLYKFFSQRVDENTLSQYFGDVPPLEELANNIKMLLLYNHFVLFPYNLLPANVKEVGGYHVAKPKDLPKDLRKFIEESDHGVIYISFGTTVNHKSMSEEKKKAIVNALSELPQRAVWKFEEGILQGNTENIYIRNWLPQNDILAHPKVVAFISHCGLLGVTEAIHHGVPIIAMPVLAEQPTNAAALEEIGFGVQIHIDELTKENILEKLKTVLDPQNKVKSLSKAWHDRPMSAMDTAIYWTEYAARHNFTFKSPAPQVPLYQYLFLDVIAVLLLISVAVIIGLKLLLRWCLYDKKTGVINEKEKGL